ncbi:MAG: type I-U CRISPR-associated protein Cas7 [Pirellula sp.]|nr:type I-U CRISPR-associated protein Cas7 [Pirellula sp.]
MSGVEQFDSWLTTDVFAALVIREFLEPVEGPDGVLFPPTYAPAEDRKVFPGGYNIDPPEGERNVCLIDSVGSQANRIEPIFATPEFAHLVPKITVRAGERSISILEAGHRAGDALVRCTALQSELRSAFKAAQNGDVVPLAKIAPTSLVFGVWDSRDTQLKLPRLVASTIRAFDVKRLTRAAQYNPSIDYIGTNLLKPATDRTLKDAYAARGFVQIPAIGANGGVIVGGEIRRDATLSLAALRLLTAGGDAQKTLVLRRYILGLALVALTTRTSTYLRQGCNLVPNEKPQVSNLVHSDGKRESRKLSLKEASRYATEAARAFGIAAGREAVFDPDLAFQDIRGEGDVKKIRKAAAKKSPAES